MSNITKNIRFYLAILCTLALAAGIGLPLAKRATAAQANQPPFATTTQQRAGKKYHVLYVTESKGFRHQSLHESEDIIEQLGAANGFDVTLTHMAEKYITPQYLKNLDVIVFYTTGELPLTDEQKKAFLNFIKSGKGFVGIHSATDTFYQWPEYGEMIGAYFDGHPWTQENTVTITNLDPKNPISGHWEESFSLKEETYQFRNFEKDKVKVTMCLDKSKTDMTKKGVKATEFPLTWYRDYGKGRVFYTALGHRPEVWRDQRYQKMI
ncbi:MAG: ThuA domain-containing protein, partial [Blastocatellia bacterium]|nr:ThuA domain-containing protein [Blastocatellia bacterium]